MLWDTYHRCNSLLLVIQGTNLMLSLFAGFKPIDIFVV